MDKILKYLKGDKVIWIITILFMGISLLCVYSFVPILVRTQGGSPFGYLFKHLVYIIIGLAVIFWVHLQDPKNIEKLSKFIFVIAVGLLIFTFFFGVSINNATRWVRVPIIGLTFQTSDLVKFALVIFLAHRLVSKRELMSSWKEGFLPIIFPVLLVFLLIVKDNFSTAALILMVCVVILFVAKFPFKQFAAFVGGGIGIAAITVLINFAFPALHLLPRMDTWMNRLQGLSGGHANGSTQALYAQLAIYNGGFTGVGVGNGELKLYTPQAYADFFYSSFVEEFGAVLAILLVVLVLILFYRILKVALNAHSLFETYAAIGIGLMLLASTMVNMFVCTGIMPVTGQNIPFLSMGGSAMITNCAALGVVLSISRKNDKLKAKNS